MHAGSLLRTLAALAMLWPAAVAGEPAGAGRPPASAVGHGPVTAVPGLSADETDDLRAGRGAGLARVADVLGYPGPRHVLDAWAAGQMALDASQITRITGIHDAMAREARRLGALVLEAERDLAAALGSGAIDAATMAAQVDRIAALWGTLRGVHLRAHLETRATLGPEQIERYATLRGHGGDAGGHGHGP